VRKGKYLDRIDNYSSPAPRGSLLRACALPVGAARGGACEDGVDVKQALDEAFEERR
jgi:hypothetical protein